MLIACLSIPHSLTASCKSSVLMAETTGQATSQKTNIKIFVIYYFSIWLSRCLSGKDSACQHRRCRRLRFSPWARKISWRRIWQPTPVFLPGESCRQRSMVGYSFSRLWVKLGNLTASFSSLSGVFAKPVNTPGWGFQETSRSKEASSLLEFWTDVCTGASHPLSFYR